MSFPGGFTGDASLGAWSAADEGLAFETARITKRAFLVSARARELCLQSCKVARRRQVCKVL